MAVSGRTRHKLTTVLGKPHGAVAADLIDTGGAGTLTAKARRLLRLAMASRAEGLNAATQIEATTDLAGPAERRLRLAVGKAATVDVQTAL